MKLMNKGVIERTHLKVDGHCMKDIVSSGLWQIIRLNCWERSNILDLVWPQHSLSRDDYAVVQYMIGDEK